ncbi:acyltransferase, putative [Syntrophotalea carbinolica DSM 2380]|uniref:Acyltransferase, putative n=1 Tax=Syntrophotalea carbinolica (strain DSM 2380 / NBRC 103641 / GraBd1) TaxID=338963 RepID=Q3A169_SYNC1|nr:lysophospholipid acyltransferase family protein [Syntrophotalea carbinolica]ABA89888.1 acyltransferase, putative [Syntrophotalea carbinolica DSM 2380]
MSSPAAKSAWSSKSLGNRFQHQIFYALLRLAGPWPAYGLLHLVVFWYNLRPSMRRNAGYFLTRRFGRKIWPVRFWQSFQLTLSFGKVLLDRAMLGVLGRGEVTVAAEDMDNLRKMLDRGRGVVMLNAHFGCWQTGMAGLEAIDRPVNIVLQKGAGDVDKHYFEHRSGGAAVHLIDPSGPFGGTLDMLAALKRNEIVCIMGDRVVDGDANSVAVDFMGGKVKMPFSIFSIASAAGAPVAVTLIERQGPGLAKVHFADCFELPPDLGKSPAALRPWVQRYAGALERMAWQKPYQFFNFFDMWVKE